MHATDNCLNCDQPLAAQQGYCASCGQSAHQHRISFGYITHEFFHAFTHTDKSILSLTRDLLLRPGTVLKEYIAGKRKKYFNPFTYLVLVSALSILVLGLTNKIPAKPFAAPQRSATAPQSPQLRQLSDAQMARAKAVNAFVNKKQNLMMLIAVPFYALAFWLAFVRRKENYAEHFVANIFLVAFIMLATSLLFYPLMALARGTPYFWWVLYAMVISHAAYAAFAYIQWFSLRGWGGRLYTLAVAIFASLAWGYLTRMVFQWYIMG